MSWIGTTLAIKKLLDPDFVDMDMFGGSCVSRARDSQLQAAVSTSTGMSAGGEGTCWIVCKVATVVLGSADSLDVESAK